MTHEHFNVDYLKLKCYQVRTSKTTAERERALEFSRRKAKSPEAAIINERGRGSLYVCLEPSLTTKPV